MRIADVLPLTPLQQGLLFHASTARGGDDDVYAVQLAIGLSGRLDQRRLRDAVYADTPKHLHGVALRSLRAHLHKLQAEGVARLDDADRWTPV